MAKQLPKITYNEVNQSQVPPIDLLGAHGLILPTLRGQADKPYEVQSIDDFVTLFGGWGTASPYFAQIRRALARGTTFFIQRLLATGAVQASTTLAGSGVTVTADDFGAWANGTVTVAYTPLATGVNGVPGTNQLAIKYSLNPKLNEVFQSTSLAGLIAAVNAGSAVVTITTTGTPTEPASSVAVPIALASGADGTFANVAAQDVAVQALFTKFDNNSQIGTLSCMGAYTLAHYVNLQTYVENRKDIMGLFEIDPSLTTTAAVTFVGTLSPTPSQYMAVYYGSTLTAYSPEQRAVVAGPILADVLSVWSVSDTIGENVYLAPAGSRRGLIPNVQDFSNNLLAAAKLLQANSLVGLGVNIVGNHPSFGPIVYGADTFANSGTAFDAINVRRTMTALRQLLTPIYASELFQPMNPVTWRDAYTKAKAVLTKMVSDSAIYAGWTYTGDQEASLISDAVYNKPIDLANGLYKVKISVVPVGYIHDITIEVDADNLLVLFNENASIITG